MLNTDTTASNAASAGGEQARKAIAIIRVCINAHLLPGDDGCGGGDLFFLTEQAASRTASSTLTLKLELELELQGAGDGELSPTDTCLRDKLHICLRR